MVLTAMNRPFRMQQFERPTVPQVQAYVDEMHLNVDPGKFVDYYAARGWMIQDRIPLVDWKAMVRSWGRRDQGQRLPGPAAPREQFASLGALQVQLKNIEEELSNLLYPGGSAFRVALEGEKLERAKKLAAQRMSIKERIGKF